MKVYVLLRGVSYEGYQEPEGVFSTLRLAKQAGIELTVKEPDLANTDKGEWLDIFEMDLDTGAGRQVPDAEIADA